jgi:hypothetical protein
VYTLTSEPAPIHATAKRWIIILIHQIWENRCRTASFEHCTCGANVTVTNGAVGSFAASVRPHPSESGDLAARRWAIAGFGAPWKPWR